MASILVVEDERVIRSELRRVLKRAGYEVAEVGSVSEARQQPLTTFDLILTDLRLPGGAHGDALLDDVEGQVPVVLMTAFGSIRSAVDAMKRGAADYLSKPIDTEDLLEMVERVLASHTASNGDREGSPTVAVGSPHLDGMIGSSRPMQAVFRTIAKVAPTSATVLVLGETGTGKELVARALHAHSTRADETFVPVNCASVPEGLIESELFGHEKGAFTGATNARTGLVEAAHRGTLFLDEVAELPLSAQARLLRVVQESEVRRVGSNTARRVDVRLVAATHRDLNTMVRRGEFRQDLYFRLKVLELTLPPLRERGNDILELAEAFLNATARRMNARVQFSPRAHEAMLAYPWPGNVRELRHAIERAVILHEDGWLTPDLLGLDQQTAQAPQLGLVNPLENVSLEDYFRAFVLQNQGHMTETELAESLGISRKTLWERRKRMGIPRKTS